MKISIIGGGPAGLYCAIAIKQQVPQARIKVFEARNESVNELGLGYVLQNLHMGLLQRIDPQFLQNLYQDEPPPKLSKASVRVDHLIEERAFELGYTVTRHRLMNYLRALAVGLDIKVVEQKIVLKDIPRLKRNSDLVIAADGKHSLVRRRYEKELKATEIPSNIRFSWYYNDSEQVQHTPRFWAVSTEFGVLQMISYPQTDKRQIVIMEMTQSCYERGGFAERSPEDIAEFLSARFAVKGDEISMTSGKLPWLPFSQNHTERLFVDNVALVGESAFSFHYGFGWGLATAFSMGYMLARCLSNQPLDQALEKYQMGAKLSLKKSVETSLQTIDWMGSIDHHFQETPSSELIEHYLRRYNYRTEQSPLAKTA